MKSGEIGIFLPMLAGSLLRLEDVFHTLKSLFKLIFPALLQHHTKEMKLQDIA
jgi:hypothetical protein